jgi:hypothetical protein
MSSYLQKYQEVEKALTFYGAEYNQGQMALISIDPALPCFLCGEPAIAALIAPARAYESDSGTPWLIFPICPDCEERQVTSQSPE